MKKWFLIFCLLLFPFQYKANAAPDLAAGAEAAVLIEKRSGRVLYAKKENQPMRIASITKIMTAIVAIEKGNLDEMVKVGPRSVGVEGSSIYLQEGQRLPLRTLLYGLMLRSGNDAATAIAEHVGGSVEGFVFLMNQKAEYLGLENTSFANPHGLDHPEHHSSALDMAMVTRYAMNHPEFREIVKTEIESVPWSQDEEKRTFYNKNRLLHLYPWADGVKTGYTKQAHRTLVSSATKNGVQLIAVTLNDGDDWNDSIQMFNHGFMNYRMKSIPEKGLVVQKTKHTDPQGRQLQLIAGKSLSYPLTKEEEGLVTVKPIVSLPLQTVRKSGEKVGTLRIYLEDELIGSVPLLSRFQKDPSILDSWSRILSHVVFKEGFS